MSDAHDRTITSLIARAFVEARQAGRSLDVYPGAQPTTLDAAYAIQDEAIAAWPDRIAGWKLGRISAPLDARFGAGRLAGPIFSGNVWTAGHGPTRFNVFPGGFAAVEAEFVLELGQTASYRERWDIESVIPLISRVFTGIEVAGSPFSGINDHGPAVSVSDFGNNAGLILGREIKDWRERLANLTCTMAINDVVVGRGGAASIPGGPLDSLVFLLNHMHRRGRQVEAGQLISTGAATGVHKILAGQSAFADFGPEGCIDCLAVPAVLTS